MYGPSFQTNPYPLRNLLYDCHIGTIQLPDFQRSWVWDEDRIKSLIASVSQAYPIGALMVLGTGGEVDFKPHILEGAPDESKTTRPHYLILDGQQRLTSLYQVAMRDQVVETITPKKKKIRRWFYIDIRKALDSNIDRESTIIGMPEDRILRKDFGREELLNLSSPELEFANFMFPVGNVFDWDTWQDGFNEYWRGDVHEDRRKTFKAFKDRVLENFKSYQVPVIALDNSTSKEAVCIVFEKVNTGGKPLDAFELVTAMYAASGHELRKDWFGTKASKGRVHRLSEVNRIADSGDGILSKVANTDFLQAISLFHTRDIRRKAEADGKRGKELPAVTANRQALLNLPLDAYKRYENQIEQGFVRAAKFLHILHIYRTFDLPYQSQLIPLAAILADIGSAWEHTTNREKLQQWYWNGVFGELYGSAVDTRIAKDFMEVPPWLNGGPEPSTVSETLFRPDRLKTMRMRLSAAYKGMNALLMKEEAKDFRSGQRFDHTVFFGENVDIHHIFPRDWCTTNKKTENKIFDSIINKTPLSYKTNRILGGCAPSDYLDKLEKGNKTTPPIEAHVLDSYLESHCIDPVLLRDDDYEGFLEDRQRRLLSLIEKATGKSVYRGDVPEEGEELDDTEEM